VLSVLGARWPRLATLTGVQRIGMIDHTVEASLLCASVVAPVLDLEGMHEVVASCDTFKVDARERIELRSGGELVHHAAGTARLEGGRVELHASPGAIRLNANDEVQLLGEMILLNCDHPSMATPMPSWAAGPRVVRPEIPPEATSGDASVIAELLGK